MILLFFTLLVFFCLLFSVFHYYVYRCFKFLPPIFGKKVRKRIAIVTLKNNLGERQNAENLRECAAHLGWDAYINFSTKNTYRFRGWLHSRVHKILSPDFIIYNQPRLKRLNDIPSYVFLDIPIPLRDKNNFVNEDGTNIVTFDAVLYVGEQFFSQLKDLFKEFKKLPFITSGFMNSSKRISTMISSVKTQNPKKIFYCGANWDDRRRGFQHIFQELDKEKIVNIYGPEKAWTFLEYSYKGMISFDEFKNLFIVMKEAGISLCLHSQEHLSSGVPTQRIIEAAAASTVIISDQHKFVKDKFGDSVLYLDEGRPIFEQIMSKYDWILKNPDQSEKMAQKAHRIFLENFTTEKLLKKIDRLHQAFLKGDPENLL